MSQNLDLSAASIGQTIDVPYETTIGESQQVLWMSTFQIHDRIFTSSPFAQLLHLPSHVLPFYMILFKAISMGHVDETREVSFRHTYTHADTLSSPPLLPREAEMRQSCSLLAGGRAEEPAAFEMEQRPLPSAPPRPPSRSLL